jgi:hypothetical protein
MSDEIDRLAEQLRRQVARTINAEPPDRASLEEIHGRVWNPQEVARDFELIYFEAPFVVVRRRSDRQLGSMKFRHEPRFYFDFVPADEEEVRAMGRTLP